MVLLEHTGLYVCRYNAFGKKKGNSSFFFYSLLVQITLKICILFGKSKQSVTVSKYTIRKNNAKNEYGKCLFKGCIHYVN